jgi:zinc transport system permease protein
MNDSLTLGAFFDAWELFRMPALAGTLAGVLLGWLGVYVVLRRMVFVSAALSQSAGFGVAGAFWLQIHASVPATIASPVVGSLVATVVVALLLSGDGGRKSARKDALLGLAYLTGTAGTLVIGTRIVQEVQDIESILLGSAVAILPSSFWLVVATAAGILLLHAWWMRGFLQASFDHDGALVRGLPVRLLDTVLLASIATAISVTTRTLGALPVFAFSVLPAMAAVRLVANTQRALVLSAVFGGACGFAGYVLAFLYELPVGPTQTLSCVAVVAVAAVVERVRRHR